jgi:hypothetical protein
MAASELQALVESGEKINSEFFVFMTSGAPVLTGGVPDTSGDAFRCAGDDGWIHWGCYW